MPVRHDESLTSSRQNLDGMPTVSRRGGLIARSNVLQGNGVSQRGRLARPGGTAVPVGDASLPAAGDDGEPANP